MATGKHYLLTLILLITGVNWILGRTTYSSCYVYTVRSQNNNFFLRTTPFDNIEETRTGITTIFNKDSSQVYQIPIHFEVSKNRKELFLSNDGKTIVYVIDREFHWNGIKNKSIQIFRDGQLIQDYELTELIKCDTDSEDCFLFYKEAIDTIIWKNRKKEIIYKANATDFQKKLTKKSTYIKNDTLYIFTKTSKLIKLNLNTAQVDISSFNQTDKKIIPGYKQPEVSFIKFKASSLYGLPDLSSGKTFEKELAKHLNMNLFPEDSRKTNKFKKHSVYVEVLIDILGNAELLKIDNYSELPNDKIKAFIETQRFTTGSIPDETEKWRFKAWVSLMNRSKKGAKKEKQQELIKEHEAYKKRIVADSINGQYIPKNLEECFIELNKVLKPKEIDAIKNLKDRNETILYHHGLGTWLRNNWGLWGGSRLQLYLIEKGIRHPDEMSAIILKFYYDWLNGENEDWKHFENS